jgi:hypothetical protein
MQFSKTDKKVMVAILKGARTRIVKNQDKYVCHAVNNTYGPTDARILTKQYIRYLLNGSITLEGWIASQFHEMYSQQWKSLSHQVWSNFPKMKETRLAWIDNMIKELSA